MKKLKFPFVEVFLLHIYYSFLTFFFIIVKYIRLAILTFTEKGNDNIIKVFPTGQELYVDSQLH